MRSNQISSGTAQTKAVPFRGYANSLKPRGGGKEQRVLGCGGIQGQWGLNHQSCRHNSLIPVRILPTIHPTYCVKRKHGTHDQIPYLIIHPFPFQQTRQHPPTMHFIQQLLHLLPILITQPPSPNKSHKFPSRPISMGAKIQT